MDNFVPMDKIAMHVSQYVPIETLSNDVREQVKRTMAWKLADHITNMKNTVKETTCLGTHSIRFDMDVYVLTREGMAYLVESIKRELQHEHPTTLEG